jgi:large subunit ribosomal protein L25
MRKDITITAQSRTTRGKNEARRLRVQDLSPAIVYGAGQDPVAIAVSPKELNRILHSASGHNTIFNLDIAGAGNTPVMIVDWQRDPVSSRLLHADLKRIDLTRKLKVSVAVHFTGEAQGVKIQGGQLEVVTREIEVECLPDDIPEHFSVSVAPLMIGQSIRASDITLPESIKLTAHPDQVLVHVVGARVEEAAAAPAEAAEAKPAEPEVIKKGKKEVEGEAPAAEAKKKK